MLFSGATARIAGDPRHALNSVPNTLATNTTARCVYLMMASPEALFLMQCAPASASVKLRFGGEQATKERGAVAAKLDDWTDTGPEPTAEGQHLRPSLPYRPKYTASLLVRPSDGAHLEEVPCPGRPASPQQD